MKFKKIVPFVVGFSVLISPIDQLVTKEHKSYTVEAATTIKTLYKAKIKVNSIVRSQPRAKDNLGTIKKGATIEVVNSVTGWVKFKYGKKLAWIQLSQIEKVVTVIPGAPKKSNGSTLASGSKVLPLDMVKANNVKVTNSWNVNTKKNEVKLVASAIGGKYFGSGNSMFISFVSIPKAEDFQFDDVTLEQRFFTSGKRKVLSFGFNNFREILKPECEYLLKVLLKPYLPNSYSVVSQKFIREDYFIGRNNMEKATKYDGYNVQMVGGTLEIWK